MKHQAGPSQLRPSYQSPTLRLAPHRPSALQAPGKVAPSANDRTPSQGTRPLDLLTLRQFDILNLNLLNKSLQSKQPKNTLKNYLTLYLTTQTPGKSLQKRHLQRRATSGDSKEAPWRTKSPRWAPGGRAGPGGFAMVSIGGFGAEKRIYCLVIGNVWSVWRTKISRKRVCQRFLGCCCWASEVFLEGFGGGF